MTSRKASNDNERTAIRDIHIIFWLNFYRINFFFVICIFASKTNKKKREKIIKF